MGRNKISFDYTMNWAMADYAQHSVKTDVLQDECPEIGLHVNGVKNKFTPPIPLVLFQNLIVTKAHWLLRTSSLRLLTCFLLNSS